MHKHKYFIEEPMEKGVKETFNAEFPRGNYGRAEDHCLL